MNGIGGFVNLTVALPTRRLVPAAPSASLQSIPLLNVHDGVIWASMLRQQLLSDFFFVSAVALERKRRASLEVNSTSLSKSSALSSAIVVSPILQAALSVLTTD